MRLYELHGPEHWEKINKTMRKAGYTELGSGVDSTVWGKDAGRVIKILMPERGDLTPAEKVFLAYYETAQKYSDNPHMMKFVRIGGQHYTKFDIDGETFYQIAVEKLRPLPGGSFEEAVVWAMSECVANRLDWPAAYQYLTNPKSKIWQYYEGDSEAVAKKIAASKRTTLKYLYLTMQLIYHIGRKQGFGWDLHTENAMLRNDGTIVITDPWYSSMLDENFTQAVTESVDTDKILQYVKREHAPEEFNIDYAITDHPEWELKNIPISRLKLDPDGEEKDPYGRVNWVDYDTVRDLTPKIGSVLKTSPIVVDRDGWIIDGNHRAMAAVEAGLDSVPAYVPVAMHDTSEAVNPDIVKSNFHAEKNIDIEGIGTLKLTAHNINTDTPPQFRVDVTNDQGQTIGYFRFVVMDWEPEPKYRIFSRFAKRKDPYVIGGNVNVWKEYQRRGIARAVYQWIKSMGNDIKPSTTQTSAGQAMWRGFAADPIEENFADKKVKGKSRPGRVKRAGASCAGSVTDLRARAKKYGGERGKMYHWCANMKAGKKK